MIIYNIVECLVESKEYHVIHSSYYDMSAAKRVIEKLQRVDKGHTFEIVESCLHYPSEANDLLKQLN